MQASAFPTVKGGARTGLGVRNQRRVLLGLVESKSRRVSIYMTDNRTCCGGLSLNSMATGIELGRTRIGLGSSSAKPRLVKAQASDEDIEELVPSGRHGKSSGTVLPFVGVACLGAILFGYHLGVVNGALEYLAKDLGITQNTVLQGNFEVFAGFEYWRKGMASTLVLVVVFVFDLIAFALAVAAEQRRTTATIVKNADSSYCEYDKDIATGLGVGAFLFLTASQVLIMVVTRCLCLGKPLRPSGSRSCAIALFITSWVFFIIAVSCLLGASVRNAYHTRYRMALSCKVVRKGIFAAGAAFIVFTGIVSELYYVGHSKANDGQASYNKETGVRMGNL